MKKFNENIEIGLFFAMLLGFACFITGLATGFGPLGFAGGLVLISSITGRIALAAFHIKS